MEVKKIELECPKEITDVGEALEAVLSAVGKALEDGWDLAEDAPTIVMAAVAQLGKAAEGAGKIPDEFKNDPLMASAGIVAPTLKGTKKLMDSLKKE